MKRNSTTLYLQSPGATTPIPWVEASASPDFSAFTEPTLSVLQTAWQDFLDSGEDLEIIPDPEPVEEFIYNPSQFLQQMFANAAFAAWMENFTPFQQTGFANTATNAKIDNNWTVMQSVYDQFKAGVVPSQAAIDEWQGYADANKIPFTF